MSEPDSDQVAESSRLTPEQRLEPSNSRLLNAGIETIHDMETLRACVGYENVNQQQTRILERLARRGQGIRSEGEWTAVGCLSSLDGYDSCLWSKTEWYPIPLRIRDVTSWASR